MANLYHPYRISSQIVTDNENKMHSMSTQLFSPLNFELKDFSKNENKRACSTLDNFSENYYLCNIPESHSSISERDNTIISYDSHPLPHLSHEDIMLEEDSNNLEYKEELNNYVNQDQSLDNGYAPQVYKTLKEPSHSFFLSDFGIRKNDSYVLNNPKDFFRKDSNSAHHIIPDFSNFEVSTNIIAKDYHYDQLKASQYTPNFPVRLNRKNEISALKDGLLNQHNGNNKNMSKSNKNYKNNICVTGQTRISRRNAWGNFSYADLITKAIRTSPDKKLTLSQIYDWMIQYIPYFKDKVDKISSAGWKNSIRHNLSLRNRFIRVENEAGRSSWWMMNLEYRKNRKESTKTKYSLTFSSPK
ncbi:unnamed protein product [Gordionus sp. m RMFG-2023]